ncbi:MAG: flagellar export chaperone FliS [Deltaproteobacteria bacterium]|nr:MAG: flagellar export chaperone FliS [Deltaproteobacteria bacterium]
MEARRLYEDVEMNTIPKINLVIMCYKKIIELLREAIEDIENGRYDKKSGSLSKAIAILTELMSALDFKRGKQIAYGLNNIYLYCLNKIIEADSRDESDALRDVIDILEDINDAWIRISKKELNRNIQYNRLRVRSA